MHLINFDCLFLNLKFFEYFAISKNSNIFFWGGGQGSYIIFKLELNDIFWSGTCKS